MVYKQKNIRAVIQALFEHKQPFATYRIPEEKEIYLVTQSTGKPLLLNHINDLNKLRGFVIAPFSVSELHPIILIRPQREEDIYIFDDIESTNNDITIEKHLECLSLINRKKEYEEYAERFQFFMSVLQTGEFDKLVLSRNTTLKNNHFPSPIDIFKMACHNYLHSYTYLYYTPQTGIWIGSTPEIILSKAKNSWSTVAIAGTQTIQSRTLLNKWDKKNRKEQEYVSSYIRNKLISSNILFSEKGPYPTFAGALMHLKTTFNFEINKNKIGDALQILHPTPAVCGLPKENAYRFILAHEGYDRSYYSGFLGWLNPEKDTNLYVNLRCMHISDKNAILYAGGGLLPSSILKDEWNETENKLQTMRRILIHYS